MMVPRFGGIRDHDSRTQGCGSEMRSLLLDGVRVVTYYDDDYSNILLKILWKGRAFAASGFEQT